MYYLLGLGQEQLAVYHGLEVQYLTQPLCGETGTNRVYFHPVEYNSFGPAGLSVVTRPDAAVPTGVKEYPIADHLGSVRVVATGPAPNAYAEGDYGTFGEPVTGAPLRVGYIEREIDPESELGDYGARKYDPVLGRFLSIDPLWALEPGLSPYVYAHNDPVGFADPWGLDGEEQVRPLGGTIAGEKHRAGHPGDCSEEQRRPTAVLQFQRRDREQVRQASLRIWEFPRPVLRPGEPGAVPPSPLATRRLAGRYAAGIELRALPRAHARGYNGRRLRREEVGT